MYATLYHYGLLTVGIFSFLLSVFVYLKAYHEPKTTGFILINITLGLWALILFMFHRCFGQPIVFWLSLSQSIAIFIPVAFIHFAFTLLGFTKGRKRQLFFLYAAASVTGCLNFTELFVTSVKYNPMLGYYHLVPGRFYPLFMFGFVAMVIYGYSILGMALKESSGFRRNEIRFYLVGSILGFIGGTTTFLPLYSINILPLGIYLVLAEEAIIAYGMMKRRLMDLRTIVGRGVIHSIVTVITVGLFLFASLRLIDYFPQVISSDLKAFLYVLGISFFSVFVLIPIRWRLQYVMERLVFKRTRTSYQSIVEGSQELLTTMDKRTLSSFFLQTVVEAANTSWGTLWLLDGKKGSYRLTGKVGNRKGDMWDREAIFWNENHSFLKVLQKRGKALLKEEVYASIKREKEVDDDIEEKLRKSDFALVIPLFFKDHLQGCLFLGDKNSGDWFSSYELEALTLFSDQAVIAFANAQLFEQVHRMKEYNERIVENVDSGIIVVNEEGQITTINEKIKQMLAVSSNQLVGKGLELLPSPLDEIAVKAWKSREPVFIPDLALRTESKDDLIASLSVSFVDSGGEKEVIFVLTDLTEMKELEEKIRQTEKMASIGSMVSQLAHEIKNPLSSIKTFTELLPEKFEDGEFRNKFFSLVSGDVKKIDDLIGRMLNLGRVQPTRFKMIFAKELIDNVLSSLELRLKEQDIKAKVSCEEDVPLIWGDPRGLEEVFLNILVNSIQAMPTGGKLNISIRVKKDKNEEKDALEMVMTDEGGGISKKDLLRIFEPFFSTKHQGSGLGLYICYQVIRSHAGEIRVRNTKKGVSVRIFLPISTNKISYIDEKK